MRYVKDRERGGRECRRYIEDRERGAENAGDI